jgi:photosystem II stability/assembly factor-like uncharacterized protein
VAIGAQQWRFDCGEPSNTSARGTLNAPLTRQGWRMCASGLATAMWGKAELMVTVSEGSGIPGDGFVVRVDPITSDCALKVSTADPSRGFEVIAHAFAGTELGWVAARWTDARALLHTVDGGRTWTELGLPADLTYVAELQFVDERNGWMLGLSGRGFQYGCDQAAPADIPRCRDVLFRTKDGGRTWTSLRVMALAPAGSPGLKEIQLVDATTGWLLERDGPAPCEIGKPCFNLLSTKDGGDSWQTALARTSMTDLHFVDRTHGWSLVPSQGGVDAIATADGGITWSRQIAGEEILGLSVPNVNVAVALTRAGAYCTASLCNKYGLFRVASEQLATVHETATSGWWTARGCGGFLGEPFFVDSHRGWIGLQRGVGGLSGSNAAGLIATVDGGATWSCVDGLPSEDVSLVWFADASHGWVTTRSDFSGPGRGGARIWRTEDGGRTWRVALA